MTRAWSNTDDWIKAPGQLRRTPVSVTMVGGQFELGNCAAVRWLGPSMDTRTPAPPTETLVMACETLTLAPAR